MFVHSRLGTCGAQATFVPYLDAIVESSSPAVAHRLGAVLAGSTKKWRYLSVAAALATATLALVGYRMAGGDGSGQVARGRAVYAQYCAACHGADLQGQPNWQSPLPSGRMPAPPHDASGHTWHHSDQELFTITKKGMAAVVPDYQSDMPAFEAALSDEEIEAVLAFIRSTWPRQERDYQAERSRQAERAGPD